MIKTQAERKVYTVTEVNRSIRMMLEQAFPQIWIEGEVSNLRRPGHIYFSLKDEHSALKAAFFKGNHKNVKFKLEDGMKVMAFGRISAYEPRGDYQIIVERMEPKGLGALQLAFEQLKKKLSEEGLFDEAHKVPIPYLPSSIGVVTSPTGAVIRDILHVTKRRFSGVNIILNPAKVQGAGAAEEIAEAIDDFDKFGKVDLLIVGRGGGSLEDLWAFNEEVVARAIYRCRIPVISAVGHEIDFTIADFVADRRAPTPSAAAEIAVPSQQELTRRVATLFAHVTRSMRQRIEFLKHHLSTLARSYVLREPLNVIRQYQQKVDDLAINLKRSFSHAVSMNQERIKTVSGKLEALSPLAVLGRGYSMTTKEIDGKLVRDMTDVKIADIIKTRVRDGEIFSKVENKSKR